MDADVIYRLGERCGACRSERGAGQLFLLGWRNVEFGHGLLKVVHERSPLLLGDLEMAVRVARRERRIGDDVVLAIHFYLP